MLGKAKNILVICSDEDMCWLLKKVLQKHNCYISTSDSIGKTVSTVSSKKLDLVMVDSPLNNISANEVLKCVRDHQADTPVIVIGHYGSDGVLCQMRELSNCKFVAKPFVIENLIKTVKQLLFPPAKRSKEKTVSLSH